MLGSKVDATGVGGRKLVGDSRDALCQALWFDAVCRAGAFLDRGGATALPEGSV